MHASRARDLALGTGEGRAWSALQKLHADGVVPLDALGHTLCLDGDARAHLHRLAGIIPHDPPPRQRAVASPALAS
ncbi:hypothetical protein [Streptomyces noursei]|uniref:hypothetical protein n=1 Tax=Streptomyces noursei TaxID=1971 RepID=UPI003B8A70DB